MNPSRMIAPVGSEVVLMAGLWGERDRFVKRQPIEWTLSQDSVGQIVDFSDRDRCWNSSKKLSADFATTQTATRSTVVTRGTPSVTDDVVQQEGQCWVSVTSASEGTTYVTVVAPKGATWPQRRQTAAVYWVDAQWVFPVPQTVRAGVPHSLSTTVTRTATGAPVTNWIVRYEVVGGQPATFGAGGATAVEVRTDQEGVGTATLQPTSSDPGSTQVRIQVIRPSDAVGDAPKTKIGEGYTTVGWSAPGLALRAVGPPTAGIDTPLVYRLEVSNPGDVTTTDVIVRDFIPPGLKFVSSNPPAQVFGDRLEWRIAALQPKNTQVIEVNCRADAGGNMRYRFEASSGNGLRTEAHVDTMVSRPMLDLDLSGPETATVGETVQYRVQITNKGDRALDNVTVTDQFAAGLEQIEGQASPVQRPLGRLEVGETKTIGLSFVVRQPGQLCHTVEVAATGGHFANAQACLTAKQPDVVPQPGLKVEVEGPVRAIVGQAVEFSTVVTNTGNVAIRDVRIINAVDGELNPVNGSGGFDMEAWREGQLVWTVAELLPGAEIRRVVECECRQETVAAGVDAIVTGSQGTTETDRATVQIQADSVPPTTPMGAGGLGGPPQGPTTPGQIAVDISEFNDPIQVGETVTYHITIKNLQAVPDQNVAMTLHFPAGLQFQNLKGNSVGVQSVADNNQTVIVTPIQVVRAGEQLPPFVVEAKGVAPGIHVLSVRVTSDRLRQGTVDEEPTTVTAIP